MKIEIEIKTGDKSKKNGEDYEEEKPEMGEEMEEALDDKQKMAIGKKLKKNMMLTRMERKLLAQYLLEEED